MRNYKSVVITGGLGFIGKHLIWCILKSNKHCSIIVIDNLNSRRMSQFISFLGPEHVSYDPSSFCSSRFDISYGSTQMTFYNIDVRNKNEIEVMFENEKDRSIVACIHLAAKVSVAESLINPDETIEVNVNGTENVIASAIKAGIPQFVFASSAAVYGFPSKLPVSEHDVPRPISPYGLSKLRAENVIAQYARDNQKAISLRLFNAYGLGQTKEYAGVITKFADRIRRNLPPVIYGTGLQTRDFISVDDVVIAFMKAARLWNEQSPTGMSYDGSNEDNIHRDTLVDTHQNRNKSSEIYNIGTGIPTTINNLACLMNKILEDEQGVSVNIRKPIYLDPLEGDIIESYADVSKARNSLNFKPAILLRSGLEQMFRRRNN